MEDERHHEESVGESLSDSGVVDCTFGFFFGLDDESNHALSDSEDEVDFEGSPESVDSVKALFVASTVVPVKELNNKEDLIAECNRNNIESRTLFSVRKSQTAVLTLEVTKSGIFVTMSGFGCLITKTSIVIVNHHLKDAKRFIKFVTKRITNQAGPNPPPALSFYSEQSIIERLIDHWQNRPIRTFGFKVLDAVLAFVVVKLDNANKKAQPDDSNLLTVAASDLRSTHLRNIEHKKKVCVETRAITKAMKKRLKGIALDKEEVSKFSSIFDSLDEGRGRQPPMAALSPVESLNCDPSVFNNTSTQAVETSAEEDIKIVELKALLKAYIVILDSIKREAESLLEAESEIEKSVKTKLAAHNIQFDYFNSMLTGLNFSISLAAACYALFGMNMRIYYDKSPWSFLVISIAVLMLCSLFPLLSFFRMKKHSF